METLISTSTTKRASRHVRPDDPRHMRLTERDIQVVKAVNDFRLMRQDQITRLLFPSKNTAQVRLQLLWQHGYLKRHFLPVTLGNPQLGTILYAVDIKGAQLLRRNFGYNTDRLRLSKLDRFDQRFLEHTLGLAETRLALETSCRQHGHQIKIWMDEKDLKRSYDRVALKNRLVAVLPDAYVMIELASGSKLHFFVEYDTASENLKFLSQKFRAYWVYFQSGKAKARYGTDLIRVLTIIESGQSRPSQTRLKNLTKLTSELTAVRWFWFTNSSQLPQSDILTSPIWSRADTPTPLPLTSK